MTPLTGLALPVALEAALEAEALPLAAALAAMTLLLLMRALLAHALYARHDRAASN